MIAGPNISEFAALLGDPARTSMVMALMGGLALPATELAFAAGVTPQTASSHLKKLLAAGLIDVDKRGRHKYYRLANADIAAAIEAMMQVASNQPNPKRRRADNESAMRLARTCYDHLAGRLGVAVTDSLAGRGYILEEPDRFQITRQGKIFFTGLGVDFEDELKKRRKFAYPCLDWSERRMHMAGSLGAAVANGFFTRGWLKRRAEDRSLIITESGRTALSKQFGINLAV